MVVGGLLGIIAGIILLGWPAPSLLVLAVILGIFLLFFGVLQLMIGPPTSDRSPHRFGTLAAPYGRGKGVMLSVALAHG